MKTTRKPIRFNKPTQGNKPSQGFGGGFNGLQSSGGTLDYSIPTCPVIEWPHINIEDKGV